jgi:hypothetical protein
LVPRDLTSTKSVNDTSPTKPLNELEDLLRPDTVRPELHDIGVQMIVIDTVL